MEKFLAIFHVADITQKSPALAVETGFLAWGLLAFSMAAIFVVVLLVNKFVGRKNKDK